MSDDGWPAPPCSPALRDDAVHVWQVRLDLPGPREIDALAALLPPDERAHVERVRVEARRRRLIVARGLVRQILAQYLDMAPTSVRFARSARGKPALIGSTLHFNLSHSHERALVAISAQREVGVDVERIRETVPLRRLGARFFTAAEQAVLRADPGGPQSSFFRLWTYKEAYLKATGEGVSRPLAEVDVTAALDGRGYVCVRDVPDVRFALRELRPDQGYAAALAVEGSVPQLSTWRWPP